MIISVFVSVTRVYEFAKNNILNVQIVIFNYFSAFKRKQQQKSRADERKYRVIKMLHYKNGRDYIIFFDVIIISNIFVMPGSDHPAHIRRQKIRILDQGRLLNPTNVHICFPFVYLQLNPF